MSVLPSGAGSLGPAAAVPSAVAVSRACKRVISSLLRTSPTSSFLCRDSRRCVPVSFMCMQLELRVSAAAAVDAFTAKDVESAVAAAVDTTSPHAGLPRIRVLPSVSAAACRSAAATLIHRRRIHASTASFPCICKCHCYSSASGVVPLYFARQSSAALSGVRCLFLLREQQQLLPPCMHSSAAAVRPSSTMPRNRARDSSRALKAREAAAAAETLVRRRTTEEGNTERRFCSTVGAAAVPHSSEKPARTDEASSSTAAAAAACSRQAAAAAASSSPSSAPEEEAAAVLSSGMTCVSAETPETQRAAAAAAPVAGALEAIPLRDPLVNATFSSKKIPKNYVKETLIPHLESQITVMAKGLDEQQLTSLAAAYAKLPPELRHYELEKELCSRILFRVEGYNPQQIVHVLWPLYTLLQTHPLKQQLPLWRAFAERIEKEFILRELSVLNLISVLRVFQKIQDRLTAETTLSSSPRSSSSSRVHSSSSSRVDSSSSSRVDNSSSSSSVDSSSSRGVFQSSGSVESSSSVGEAEKRHEAMGVGIGSAAAAAGGEREERGGKMMMGAVVGEGEETETGIAVEKEGEFCELLWMLEGLLRKGLASFDAIELHDIVVSLSQHHRDTRRDRQLLQLLLPLVEKRVQELSLLHLLSLLRALVKMKIIHADLFDKAATQLQDIRKVRNMPPKYIAQVVWLFARVGRLFDVACTMAPLMERHISNFSAIDFARLAQALPPQSSVPLRVCQQLQSRISSFAVNDFCFFFAACIRLSLLPDASGSIPHLQQQQQSLHDAAEGQFSRRRRRKKRGRREGTRMIASAAAAAVYASAARAAVAASSLWRALDAA